MTIIKPFASIRPNKNIVDKVAALPYDVYNRKEAKEVTKNNKLSFLNIDRPETNFDDNMDMYDEKVYLKAKELLEGMILDGTFITDNKKCYYVYELTMNGRKQTGIVGCASIDDYINNIIKKHENTREEKEQDRIKHVDICNTQTGPIFLAYRHNDIIKEIILKTKQKECIYDFTSDDGITHRVWIIDEDENILKIENAFENINEVYIADGHHRCASAVKVGLKRRKDNPNYNINDEFNYFLSVLFMDEELKILPYNRVVADLNGNTVEEFINKIKNNFSVTESKTQVMPQNKYDFGMYLEEKWYTLSAKENIKSKDAVKGLDVSILQDYILTPVLNIEDPRTDKRIDFVGGIRGLNELEYRCSNDMKVAFSMFPTSIQELFNVADNNLLMPPKSTWFEPKLRSGLFLHKLS